MLKTVFGKKEVIIDKVIYLNEKETKKPINFLRKYEELNKEKSLYILVSDFKTAEKLKRIADKNGIAIRFPITVFELKKNNLSIKDLVIFDLEKVFKELLNKDINIEFLSIMEDSNE